MFKKMRWLFNNWVEKMAEKLSSPSLSELGEDFYFREGVVLTKDGKIIFTK